MSLRGIIFDLDDTLYPEKDYVFSGFEVISNFLQKKYHLDAKNSLQFLQSNFEANGRDKIFDLLLSTIMPEQQKNEQLAVIKEMVEIYRNHSPNIDLNIETIDLLNEIKCSGWKMSIVTDGLPLMQKNKIQSLGLDSFFDTIIYCWEYKCPKPSPIGFKIASEKMNIDIENCLIVGDHPEKDIVPARQLNAKAYRIQTQRFSHLGSNIVFPPLKSFSTLSDFFNEIIKYANK